MPNPTAAPPDFELRKYEFDRTHELELNKFAHALEVERLKVLQYVNGGAFAVTIAFAHEVLSAGGKPALLAALASWCWVLGLAAAAVATQFQTKAQAKFNQAVRYRRNAIEWRQLEPACKARLTANVGQAQSSAPAEPPEQWMTILCAIRAVIDFLLRRDTPDPRSAANGSCSVPDSAEPTSASTDEIFQEVSTMISPLASGSAARCAADYDSAAGTARREGGSLTNWVAGCAMGSVGLFVLGAALLTVAVYRAGPQAAAPASAAQVVVW